jgi:hypothetical protein
MEYFDPWKDASAIITGKVTGTTLLLAMTIDGEEVNIRAADNSSITILLDDLLLALRELAQK